MEVVIPIELNIPTTWVAEYDPSKNEAAKTASLELIDELREEANIWNAAYNIDMVRYHDKKVRLKQFRVGSLVLRKVNPT